MASSITGTSLGATSLRSQSEMYMSMVGTNTVVRTQTFGEKLLEFKHWVYDWQTNKIFNRTPFEWLFVTLLHVLVPVFFVALAAAFLAIFYVIINWNYPYLQGADSLVQTPGLAFRPQPDYQSTVIRFVKGDTSTYTHYLDHLEAYLRYYENENQQGENYIDCSEIRERRTEDLNKVCRFNMEWLGTDCVKQQNFGFDDGQPCILLKLNKIFNWFPLEYTNETVPDEIRDNWDTWSVTVQCDGETATDRENMGPLSYVPTHGFHFRHFPFRNQQGYRSPLVFVRFERPRPGSLIMVTCKAYAANIRHDRNQMIGQTHFELLVD